MDANHCVFTIKNPSYKKGERGLILYTIKGLFNLPNPLLQEGIM